LSRQDHKPDSVLVANNTNLKKYELLRINTAIYLSLRFNGVAPDKVCPNLCRHRSAWSLTPRFHPYSDKLALPERFIFCGTCSKFWIGQKKNKTIVDYFSVL